MKTKHRMLFTIDVVDEIEAETEEEAWEILEKKIADAVTPIVEGGFLVFSRHETQQ